MPARYLLVLALLASSPASATVRGIVPVLPAGTAPPGGFAMGSQGTAPNCLAGGGFIPCPEIDIRYFGGHVISSVKIYAVFWSAGVDPQVMENAPAFYRAVVNSEYLDTLAEYSSTGTIDGGSRAGQSGLGQVIGRGTFGGSFTLTLSRTYPACGDDNCVTGSDIENELKWQVEHGNLPPSDGNTLYMVHLPANVVINDPRGIGISCQTFCGYHHTAVENDRSLYYAVIPGLDRPGCQGGCGGGSSLENTCAVASHEIAEAITDADVGRVTSNQADYPLSWYDVSSPSQGEIADMCSWSTDTLGTDGLVGCAAAPGCFRIQRLFSRTVWNADPGGHPGTPACVSTRADPSGDFSVALEPRDVHLAERSSSEPIAVVTQVTAGDPMPITLAAVDLPQGVHATFEPATVQAGDTAQLTLSTDASVHAIQDAVIAVRAAGSTYHSASLLLQVERVTEVSDWSLSIDPHSALLAPGASTTFTVSGTMVAGAPEMVTLGDVRALPEGVTASFDPPTLTPGASTSTLTLTGSGTLASRTEFTFVVPGTSESQPSGHVTTAKAQTNVPPSISLIAPAPGSTVSGVVAVLVGVTPGPGGSIGTITINADDLRLSRGTSTSASWDTLKVADGPHTITITAMDDLRVETTRTVDVIVANAPKPKPPGPARANPTLAKSGCSAGGSGPAWAALLVLLAGPWRASAGRRRRQAANCRSTSRR